MNCHSKNKLHNISEEVDVYGVKALQYRPGPNLFDMGYVHNYCFCPDFDWCAVPKVDGDGNEIDEWDISSQLNCASKSFTILFAFVLYSILFTTRKISYKKIYRSFACINSKIK